MPPLVVANCLEVAVRGNGGDGPFANVMHFDTSDATGSPANIAEDVLNAYIEELLPVLCQTVSVQDAYYLDMSSSTGDTGTVSYHGTEDTTGGVTTDACPPQVAYLVKTQTTGGRGVRGGRLFLPGVREDEVDAAGTITSITRDVVLTAFSNFGTAVGTANGAVLGVLHRNVSGPGALTIVVGGSVDASVATLRNRLNR